MVVFDKETEFTHSGFFVLRTPLLPFDEVLKWGNNLESPSIPSDSSLLEPALAADRVRLRARLKEIVNRKEIREAIFLASPDLIESITAWEEAPESDRGQRVERALVRYFMRMAGRPMPFGLFAGCSVGTIGPTTNFAIGEEARYERHTRLDMDYLCALATALEQFPSVRKTLTYRVNNSLYHAGGRVRYLESRPGKGVRSYHLVAVEASDYVETALSVAQEGATPAELAQRLTEADSSFSLAEAEEFIGELIESQLLISDLVPAVTGPEPVHELIATLRERAQMASVADRLEQTQSALEELDRSGLGNSPEKYYAITESLRTLPAEINNQRLFQIDMVRQPASATLGPAPLREIARGIELLRRISPSHRHESIEKFREAFVERYGENSERPLLEVLDSDVGIGLRSNEPVENNSPLLRGLAFNSTSEGITTWGRRDQYLLRKLSDVLRSKTPELTLVPDDIPELENKNPRPLPGAFALIASFAAFSPEALSEGRYQVSIGDLHGPSGARLLGRFCNISEAVRQNVDQHLRGEELLEPDALFAEIVHLPAGRTGNVLLRPVLRDYEIPYLGRSGTAPERQIPVTDLTVTVSDERITLRSTRLQREIIPRVTTAHYFAAGGLDVYRFLCLLQEQDTAFPLTWDWGALGGAPFLPRVCYGKLVLSAARWILDRRDLQLLGSATEEPFRMVQRLRSERGLPRFVALVDDDKELPFDLDNVLCVETFVEVVKRRDKAFLLELFPPPEESAVWDAEGKFIHQIIIPFVRARVDRPAKAPIPQQSKAVKRSFPPLSEWLYAKLYTGPSTADEVLRELRPMIDEALRSGGAERWFFIRFGDPHWHIRLRFQGKSDRLQGNVLPLLQQAVAPLFADSRLWRMQFDSYDREIARYGGPEGIVCAEKIFHADSEAVLSIIESFRGNAGLEARSLLALRAIDDFFNDFGFDLDARRGLIESMRRGFTGEIQPDLNLKRQLGRRYRDEQQRIEALLAPDAQLEGSLANGLHALRKRSEQLEPTVAELKKLAEDGRLSASLTALLPHFTHMHVNRILRSVQREEEFVLYDTLARLYESRYARRRLG